MYFVWYVDIQHYARIGDGTAFYYMSELNPLQYEIFSFVKQWANIQKTPIPKKEIVKYMLEQQIKSHVALNAINTLLIKGYIRRAYSDNARTALYVMIRNI